MANNIDWIMINRLGKQIGAVGFIGDKAAVVAAFYDDYDANKDGKVGWGERIAGKLFPLKLHGLAIAEVAMQARYEPNVVERDLLFQSVAVNNFFLNFTKGLVSQGIYTVYFSQLVTSFAKPIAGRLANNIVAQFAIRKGMEGAVDKAYTEFARY